MGKLPLDGEYVKRSVECSGYRADGNLIFTQRHVTRDREGNIIHVTRWEEYASENEFNAAAKAYQDKNREAERKARNVMKVIGVAIVIAVAAFALGGCNSSHTFMEDHTYQVDGEHCVSTWVGVINSFPTGQEVYCQELPE